MSRPEPTWIGAFQQLASPLKGLPRRWSHQQPRRRPTLTTATTTRTDTFVLPTQRNRLDQLRGRLRGAVHESSDPAYHALATPWNLAVPMRPAAVVEARTPGDVVQSVRFAGAHGITVGVQATGHGAIPSLAGHLLVSTRGLDEVTVHPQERWARVGGHAASRRVA